MNARTEIDAAAIRLRALIEASHAHAPRRQDKTVQLPTADVEVILDALARLLPPAPLTEAERDTAGQCAAIIGTARGPVRCTFQTHFGPHTTGGRLTPSERKTDDIDI